MIKKANNGKRLAAIVCAAVVGISGFGMGSTSVQAAEVGTTVSETGTMNYVDMSQYTQVLLPTSSTMAFALDPQGLSTMNGTTADAKDLAAAAGNIVSNGEVSVANYGYYPLKVRTNFYVADSGSSMFVENEADVETDTSKRIYLTITPSSTKTTVTEDGTNIIGTADYTAASEGIAVTGTAEETAQGMVFALSGAEYEFTKTTGEDGKDVYAAQRKSGGEYGTAAFKIGGKINKNADWTAYTGSTPKILKLKAVFSYSTMTNDEYAYLTDTDSGFIKAGTYNQIMDTAPEISVTEVRMDPNKGVTIPLSLGTGVTASKVKSVQVIKDVEKTVLADNSVVTDSETIEVKGFTANSTGTALNIPAVSDMKKVADQVDKTNASYYDDVNGEYLKLLYGTDVKTYEVRYSLKIKLADGTVFDSIPVTLIDAISPTVEYTGGILPKATTATAPTADFLPAKIKVELGNGGATKVTSVVLNTSKTTAIVESVNDAKATIANNTDITIKMSAFKYTSSDAVTNVVYTVTFDSGETADLVIPVAAK